MLRYGTEVSEMAQVHRQSLARFNFVITISHSRQQNTLCPFSHGVGSDSPMADCHLQLHQEKESFMTHKPAISATTVTYRTISIAGLNIAYREAGHPSSAKLVLLHGRPASSHQYRNLIPKLADRFHVIARDYPGFGNSDTPDPAKFAYTLNSLAEVVDEFPEKRIQFREQPSPAYYCHAMPDKRSRVIPSLKFNLS